MLAEFESKNNQYLKKINEESNAELLQFPSEVLRELRAVTMDIYQDLIDNDPLSKRVYESFWSFKKDITEWSRLSEQVFYNDIQ